MDHKKLVEEIKAFLSDCERVRYGELVGAPWPYNHDGPMVYTEPEDILLDQAATAITDLLARAEEAEARAEKAERERDAYKIFFDDVSSKPDCNTCCLKQCEYRPEIGQTTRFNCPLWRGQKEE